MMHGHKNIKLGYVCVNWYRSTLGPLHIKAISDGRIMVKLFFCFYSWSHIIEGSKITVIWFR